MSRIQDWLAVLSDALKDLAPGHPLVSEFDMPRRIPMPVGEKVLIRTVTYHIVGEVKISCQDEVFLYPAAWVAESGRWTHCLKTGELAEVEPYPDGCTVARDAYTEWTRWRHPIPDEAR